MTWVQIAHLSNEINCVCYGVLKCVICGKIYESLNVVDESIKFEIASKHLLRRAVEN